MTETNENETGPSKLEMLKDLISKGNISSEALAAQVIAYRALGMDKEIATTCMLELATRRKNGESFDFEKFIEEELAKIPKIPVMDLKSMNGNFSLQTIMRMMKKKKL